MSVTARLYRVGIDTGGNLERTALLEYDPTLGAEDFTIVALGELNERIEQEENVFETDDIGVTVEGLPNAQFRDYTNLLFAPWIFEVTLRSGRVWHGVVDPESIRYDHGTRRTDFDVLSYEYLWSETDLAPRSKFDTEIVRVRRSEGGGISEIGLPATTEEGFNTLNDVLIPGTEINSFFLGEEFVGVGNILIVDGDAGESRVRVNHAYLEGSTVWCEIASPADQTLYDSTEDGEYLSVDVTATSTPRTTPGLGGTFLNVRVRSRQLASILENTRPPFVLDIEAANGNTLSFPVRPGAGTSSYTIEPPTAPGEQPLVRFKTRTEEENIASRFGGQTFELLLEKETARDFEAGASISILSQIIYNTGLDEDQFSGTRFVKPIVESIGETAGLFTLGEMLNVVISPSGRSLTFPTFVELPENLRESLGLLSRRNESFYRFVPVLDGGDLPRYDIEFINRQDVIESSAIAAKDVISASEDAAEWAVPAVVVTPNKDYFKPAGVEDVAGWYYETADGTPITSVPDADLRQYTKPSSAEILEVEVADVPAYAGSIFGSGGNAVRNDDRLRHIAESFYKFYKGLARSIQLTVKGELDDIVGKFLSFAELGLETQFGDPEGRIIWVREASVSIEGNRTTIRGRIGDSSITVDSSPSVDIRSRRAYETDPGTDLEVIFGTYAIDPSGGDLSYMWSIGPDDSTLSPVTLTDDNSFKGSSLALKGTDALAVGSYYVEVTVTSAESGLTATDGRRILVIPRATSGPPGNFNDPFRLRKFNRLVGGVQYGVLQIRFMFPRVDIQEIVAAKVSGDELPEDFTYDLSISTTDREQVFEIDTASTPGFNEDEVVFEIRVPLHPIHTSTIAFEVQSDGNESIDPGTVVTFDSRLDPLITNENFFIDNTGTGFLSIRGDTDVDELRWDTATDETSLVTTPAGTGTGSRALTNRIDFEQVVTGAAEGERFFVRVFAINDTLGEAVFDEITLSALRGDTGQVPDDPTFDSVTINSVGVFGGSGVSEFTLQDLTETTPASLTIDNLSAGTAQFGGSVEVGSNLVINNAENRFEFEITNDTSVALGSVNGLQKYDEDGAPLSGQTYGSDEYGLWIKPGDKAIIDGEFRQEGGSFIIEQNAAFRVVNPATGEDYLRMGTALTPISNTTARGFFALTGASPNVVKMALTEGRLEAVDFRIEAGNDFWDSQTGFSFGGGLLTGSDSTVQIQGDAIVDGTIQASKIDIENLFAQTIEVGNGGRLFASDGTTEVVRFGEGSAATAATPENLTATVSFVNETIPWDTGSQTYNYSKLNQTVEGDSVFRLDADIDISNISGGGRYQVSVTDDANANVLGTFSGEFNAGELDIDLRRFVTIDNAAAVSIRVSLFVDDIPGDGSKSVTFTFSYDEWKPTYALNETGLRVRLTDVDSKRITGTGSGGGGGGAGSGVSTWIDLNDKPFDILSSDFTVGSANKDLFVSSLIKDELVTGVTGAGNGQLTISRRGTDLFTDLTHGHPISQITNLQLELDSKVDDADLVTSVDVTDDGIGDNLGLLQVSLNRQSGLSVSGTVDLGHTHATGDISGTFGLLSVSFADQDLKTTASPTFAALTAGGATSANWTQAYNEYVTDAGLTASGGGNGTLTLDLISRDINTTVQAFVNLAHSHTISEITNLQTELDGKIDDANLIQSVSVTEDGTGVDLGILQVALTRQGGAAITNGVNLSHTHSITQVNNLQAALAGKVSTSGDTMTGALTVQALLQSEVVGAVPYFEGGQNARRMTITAEDGGVVGSRHVFAVASTDGGFRFDNSNGALVTISEVGALTTADTITASGGSSAQWNAAYGDNITGGTLSGTGNSVVTLTLTTRDNSSIGILKDLSHEHNASEITSGTLAEARLPSSIVTEDQLVSGIDVTDDTLAGETNLGSLTITLQRSGSADFVGSENLAHTHNASDITAGTLDTARLPSTLILDALDVNNLTRLGAGNASPSVGAESLEVIGPLVSNFSGFGDIFTNNPYDVASFGNRTEGHQASSIKILTRTSDGSTRGVRLSVINNEASGYSDDTFQIGLGNNTPTVIMRAVTAGDVEMPSGSLDVSGSVTAAGGNSGDWNTAYDDNITGGTISGTGNSLLDLTLTTRDGSSIGIVKNLSHEHNAGDITSGTIDPARLPSSAVTEEDIISGLAVSDDTLPGETNLGTIQITLERNNGGGSADFVQGISLNHTHDASDITGGTIDNNRLPTITTGDTDFANQSLNSNATPNFNGVVFANNERDDFDDDGRLYWDLSEGLYIKSSNANHPDPALLWSSANFNAGSNINVSYDSSTDQPTLSVNNNPSLNSLDVSGDLDVDGKVTADDGMAISRNSIAPLDFEPSNDSSIKAGRIAVFADGFTGDPRMEINHQTNTLLQLRNQTNTVSVLGNLDITNNATVGGLLSSGADASANAEVPRYGQIIDTNLFPSTGDGFVKRQSGSYFLEDASNILTQSDADDRYLRHVATSTDVLSINGYIRIRQGGVDYYVATIDPFAST